MNYADEQFYIEEYLKGKEPVVRTGFPFYARKASRILDLSTFGRLKNCKELPECVRMCCCELSECLSIQQESKKTSCIKSEKVDDYSVTYEDIKTRDAKQEADIKKIIAAWLEDTGLLYRGI